MIRNNAINTADIFGDACFPQDFGEAVRFIRKNADDNVNVWATFARLTDDETSPVAVQSHLVKGFGESIKGKRFILAETIASSPFVEANPLCIPFGSIICLSTAMTIPF